MDKHYTIDADGKILGRVASEAAVALQGKKTADYHPRLSSGAVVTINNVSKIRVSGNKAKQKIYYRHTGYIGHLKEQTFEELFAKSPRKTVWKAVYNMLPKNRLRRERIKNLKIEL